MPYYPWMSKDIHTALGVKRRINAAGTDRKSTRLNSSHSQISYAVFCLKKKNRKIEPLALGRGHGGGEWESGQPDVRGLVAALEGVCVDALPLVPASGRPLVARRRARRC